MEDTHRLKIIRYVKALYEAAVDNPTPPSGKVHYGAAFSTVALGPLGDTDNRKRFVVGLVPGPERKSDLYPLKTAMFDLTIEFRATKNKDDEEPLILAEQLLGVVQQIMYDDEDLGELCIKHDEIGNEQDMFTHQDRSIQGMVQFRIHYRHSGNSVYTTTPV